MQIFISRQGTDAAFHRLYDVAVKLGQEKLAHDCLEAVVAAVVKSENPEPMIKAFFERYESGEKISDAVMKYLQADFPSRDAAAQVLMTLIQIEGHSIGASDDGVKCFTHTVLEYRKNGAQQSTEAAETAVKILYCVLSATQDLALLKKAEWVVLGLREQAFASNRLMNVNEILQHAQACAREDKGSAKEYVDNALDKCGKWFL